MQSIGRYFLQIFCLMKKLNVWQYLWFNRFLVFFSLIIGLRMSDRFETYGSAEIRTIFMNDEEGKLIKSDILKPVRFLELFSNVLQNFIYLVPP